MEGCAGVAPARQMTHPSVMTMTSSNSCMASGGGSRSDTTMVVPSRLVACLRKVQMLNSVAESCAPGPEEGGACLTPLEGNWPLEA
jgi:hypothetical protein